MLKGIGAWPVDGESVRKTGEFVKVNEDNKLRTIHGKQHPVPFNFFFSTDLGHMGEFMIPVGGTGVRATEPLSHAGDCAVYVEHGPITFFFPGPDNDAFVVEEGEVMFIPSNTKYQCINYTSKIVKGIFSIGGEV